MGGGTGRSLISRISCWISSAFTMRPRVMEVISSIKAVLMGWPIFSSVSFMVMMGRMTALSGWSDDEAVSVHLPGRLILTEAEKESLLNDIKELNELDAQMEALYEKLPDCDNMPLYEKALEKADPKVLDEIEEKPDVIVLDPPRDGIHPKALPKILSYGVNRIVYVSCKATSLARDLEAFLQAGYRLEKACCVDQFCETVWTEAVALLVKE